MSALIQFSVTNCRSFAETATLSMVAPDGDAEGTLPVPGNPSLRLLRVAALFGANASGKSNLLRAMGSLKALAQGSALATCVDPFRLRTSSLSAPTEYQWDGVAGERQVRYVLLCTSREVVSEALYTIDAAQNEALVFEREPGAEAPLRLGAPMGGEGTDQRQFLSLNAQGTPRDQLLLRDLALRGRDTPHGVPLLDDVLRALTEDCFVFTPNTAYDVFQSAGEPAERLRAVGDLLRRYDTGIDSLTLRPVDAAPPTTPHDRDGPFAAQLRHDLAQSGIYLRPSPGDDRAMEVVELLARHRGHDAALPPLRFVDESDGTRRLLNLLPVLMLLPRGLRVLVDELDQSLHTAVAQQFIRDFLASREGDQLLFTSHDITLLDMPEIPAAAVWFVEKDREGASHLHSLAEVKPEQLARLGGQRAAGYLQGRFGGVPHIVPPGE